ncbi:MULTISPECIES: hypothetical protein [unclassified Luteococcus]|uniref:hypothetical protein n=1 Tax=unclassified Luteococcus TaxID=2639923 RepID=UPI00313AC63C
MKGVEAFPASLHRLRADHQKENTMCRPVTCKTCGKTTWAGCGQHIARVKAAVPAGQWCGGHPDQPKTSLLGRLLGK